MERPSDFIWLLFSHQLEYLSFLLILAHFCKSTSHNFLKKFKGLKESLRGHPSHAVYLSSPHLLGRALFLGRFGLYPSSLSKSVRFVSLSGKVSLVSLSDAILFLRSWHVYFPLQFEFHEKSSVGKGAWRSRWHLVPPTLYCVLLLYRVNLNKLSRNFVEALRKNQCLLSPFLASLGAQEKTDCTSTLWSFDSCQNRVSADQYFLTVSRAQVSTHRRGVFFGGLSADIQSNCVN